MIAVIQRVRAASVSVGGETVSRIGAGLLVLLGVADDDAGPDAEYLAEKTVNLRIFPDERGRMNRSLRDTGGEMLVVSQFTLLGDCRKGRRPSFIRAAQPDKAESLYLQFVRRTESRDIRVETGRFQAMMDVSLINDGPVTLILESR
jgi:D-aminoacyl-tRNA deacylase